MNINTDLTIANYHIAKNSIKIKQNVSNDDKLLKEQTDSFEAILIKQLLDTSLNNDNSLFPKQAGSEIYKSMYNDAISKEVSGGFGFSKLMFDYLKNNQNSKNL